MNTQRQSLFSLSASGHKRYGTAQECARPDERFWEKISDPDLRSSRDTADLCLRLDLSGLSLRGLDLSGLCFTACRMQGIDLSQAVLAETRFYDCDMKDSILDGTFCRGTSIRYCDISGMNAVDSRWFNGAEISRSSAVNMNWSSSFIDGLSVYGTDMDSLRSENSLFIDFTSWQDRDVSFTRPSISGSTAMWSGRLDIFGDVFILDADIVRRASLADAEAEMVALRQLERWARDYMGGAGKVPTRTELEDMERRLRRRAG